MPEFPNFTEDTVALAIEHYLTLLTWPFSRFSIELISRKKERYLGADAKLLGRGRIKFFKPFYMQFKCAHAYSSASQSRIIRDRRNWSLDCSRVLAFKLRQKRQNQREYQHNVLYRLRELLQKRKLGDAAYVCPLFLDRHAYITSMHFWGLLNWVRLGWRFWLGIPPFSDESYIVKVLDLRNKNSLELLFDTAPILHEHLVIPPHQRVNDANHFYSFTEYGDDICFHSPEHLLERMYRLSDWLTSLSIGVFEPAREFGYIPVEDAETILREITREFSTDFVAENRDISDWFAWGSFLEEQYDILQFAFVIWRE